VNPLFSMRCSCCCCRPRRCPYKHEVRTFSRHNVLISTVLYSPGVKSNTTAVLASIQAVSPESMVDRSASTPVTGPVGAVTHLRHWCRTSVYQNVCKTWLNLNNLKKMQWRGNYDAWRAMASVYQFLQLIVTSPSAEAHCDGIVDCGTAV